MIDAKRIAKNTIFMYIRMLFILVVSLYTSRVVLDKLGTDDYALYNVVYGIVGMLSFLNATLSTGTSRFITFSLGKNDKDLLRTTFSTAFSTHLALASIILVLGETVGLWYANNVMVVSPERLSAALIVYQISIVTTVISIVQVPFLSTIIAHEDMGAYALIGIIEALSLLGIAFLLTNGAKDKLILYAILWASVKLVIFIAYIWYSKSRFEDVIFRIRIDKQLFGEIIGFSGWNIIANISNTLLSQGVIMLFNLFFLPVVAAAQAISTQLSHGLISFVNNVRMAVNPQVVKLYAEEKYDESRKLTLKSAEYVFDLLLVLGLPCIAVMPALLDVWLVDVPEYAVVFAQLIVLQDILNNFSAAFYQSMVAANKIKKNSIISLFICIAQFGLLYVLFKLGFGPVWARYMGVIAACVYSFVVKPLILWKDIGYTLHELYSCIGKCMVLLFVVGALSIGIYYLIPQTSLISSLAVMVAIAVVVVIASVIFMDRDDRKVVYEKVKLFFAQNLRKAGSAS